MRRILVALGFLTIIPVKPVRRFKPDRRNISKSVGLSNGVKIDQPKPQELSRSMIFFPLIGLFIGAILVLVNRGVNLLFPHLVTNLLVVATLVILSGAFHLDGLADSIDGFYGGKTREEILAIMRDSRIGVMGVTGIILVLLAKWATLCEMPLLIMDKALLLVPTLGRWSMLLAAFLSPYARGGEGIGRPFAGQIKLFEFWIGGLFGIITSIVLFGMDGIIPFLLVGLMVIGIVRFTKKKIGGMTGDTLGSICESAEVLVLLVTIFIGKR